MRSGSAAVDVDLQPFRSQEVRVPGGDTESIRVELSHRTGIAELGVEGQPVERVVTVPDTSPNVHQFFFQRMLQDTGVLIRDFTAPRPMRVTVDSTKPVLIDAHRYSPGASLTLSPGTHRVRTTGPWVSLREEGWQPAGSSEPTGYSIAAADEDRLLVTGRAFNKGLRGYLGEEELTPREIDAATQAFVIPAGRSGDFRMTFSAQPVYRATLLFGCLLYTSPSPRD